MLSTARAMLENTVKMIQLADQYDVLQISRAGRYVEDELENAKNVRHTNELTEPRHAASIPGCLHVLSVSVTTSRSVHVVLMLGAYSRALTHRAVNLANLAAERITLLADPTFKSVRRGCCCCHSFYAPFALHGPPTPI